MPLAAGTRLGPYVVVSPIGKSKLLGQLESDATVSSVTLLEPRAQGLGLAKARELTIDWVSSSAGAEWAAKGGEPRDDPELRRWIEELESKLEVPLVLRRDDGDAFIGLDLAGSVTSLLEKLKQRGDVDYAEAQMMLGPAVR